MTDGLLGSTELLSYYVTSPALHPQLTKFCMCDV